MIYTEGGDREKSRKSTVNFDKSTVFFNKNTCLQVASLS